MSIDDMFISFDISENISVCLQIDDYADNGYLQFHVDSYSEPCCQFIDTDKNFRNKETAEKYARKMIQKFIKESTGFLNSPQQ